jgi:hypothetical protein
MAQLSRPYQILLGAVVVFGLIWAVALHGHASGGNEPVSRTPRARTATNSSSPSAAAEAKAAAAPTPIYHGAAPGVEGLTRAIAKAHGAVATSQRNAQQLQSKSSAASGEAQPSTNSSSTTLTPAEASTTVSHRATIAPTLAHRAAGPVGDRAAHAPGASTPTNSHTSAKLANGRTVEQIAVERELAQGKTVMLLFWNPKSSVDQEVQAQTSALSGRSKGMVRLYLANANQVGMFGTITEVVHIYETPTVLIVNKHGLVSTLTGLTDVFALEQAVHEAQNAVS